MPRMVTLEMLDTLVTLARFRNSGLQTLTHAPPSRYGFVGWPLTVARKWCVVLLARSVRARRANISGARHSTPRLGFFAISTSCSLEVSVLRESPRIRRRAGDRASNCDRL